MNPTINFREREAKWVVTYRTAEVTDKQPNGQRRFKRFDDETEARAWMATLDGAPAAPTSAPVRPTEIHGPVSLDGLVKGTEITVRSVGEVSPGGRYRFDRFALDGSLTCWGPINSQQAAWRNFREDRVRVVHRKSKDRAAVIEQEVAA